MRRFFPSLSALHAFEAAVRHMSFTRAAEDLGITQSGISRQIKNLEEFLGLTLFQRAGTRLVLTAEGASYYEEIARLLGRLEEVSIDAVRGRKAQGLLKIGMSPTIMRRWGAKMLTRFAKAHPDAGFEIYACADDVDLTQADLDVAVVRGTGTWSGVRSHLIFAEHLVVIGTPDLIPHGGMSEEEALAHLPLLQNSSRPSLWLHWLRGAGVLYKSRIHGPRLPTMDMVIACAAEGMGLAIIPDIYLGPELAARGVGRVFDHSQPSGEGYYICYPQARATASDVRRFRDWFAADLARSRKAEGEPLLS